MKKTISVIVVCILTVAVVSMAGCMSESAAKSISYEPTWESLTQHQIPEWFRDAKFGIYTHWGPVTVGSEDGPGGGQWYGRNMYMPNSPTFKYHISRFGQQNQVGYKDIVPLFKAEKFDSEQWAKLFAASGAKFAGPVAIHHDNFAMWDSAYTEWDSMDKGPKRDITAELEKAIRKRDMKFIATFHHAFTWRYFEPSYKFDGADPKYAGLYCRAHESDAPPTKEFMDKWLGMVNEVVEKYKPDLTWFDFGLGSEQHNCITPEYQQQMFADYYNWAVRNKRQVGAAHKHRHIHEHTGILDFERGREDNLVPYPWLTDTSVGQWFHQKSAAYKSVDQIVDVLVDIVSKNGCMLLNVGPAADGAIPPQAQEILLGIGDWLEVNGQAIYKTRPWQVFGEGPTRNTGGGFSENKDKLYTPEDIRFTRSKDGKTIYAIVLGWPGAGETVTIRSLADKAGAVKITDVKLLGHKGRLNWKRDLEGLKIDMPSKKPCEHAFALKIMSRV
ncbi:MAG: alpha-L-fucosidase [Planctomycetes bacterium]|nr:alpha-L-fucosidase [Planctomycetota bacterium]